jgi:hypothetical protein
MLALGLYYGLNQLFTAGLLAAGEGTTPDLETTLLGLLLQQGLQGLSLLVGGVLVGAGQRRGFFLGAVLGLWCGMVLMVVGQLHPQPVGATLDSSLSLTAVTTYGQLALLAAFGAMGGLIGGLVWKPLPALPLPGAPVEPAKALVKTPRKSLFDGPVVWTRAVMGVVVTVCGATWASAILKVLQKALEDQIQFDSHFQQQLVTLEICALAILIGSALAGATTPNGLKQGLLVGLGATGILLGIELSSDAPSLDKILYTALSTSFLSLAGGWFGGQLFPPIVAPSLRKRFRATPIS